MSSDKEQLNFRENKSSKTSELSTDWSLCIFCQKVKRVCPTDSKRNNTGVGYSSLSDNLNNVLQMGNLPCNLKLERLEDGQGLATTLSDHSAKWHKNCRYIYNQTVLKHLQNRKREDSSASTSSESSSTHSRAQYTATQTTGSIAPVWLQNLYQQLPHDDGCNTVMKYDGKILVDRKLQDARETEESSEDSGIQIFMPTKKGSREEESSNISSKTAQSHHSFENNVTKRGDSSPIEDFSALNINDTDFKQKISENNNDIKDEDTSLKNQSEAGPDIAEFTDEEFKSAVEFFKDPAAFEFLQKAGNSKTFEQSTLARMSLYVKFDPLLKQDSPTRRTSMQLQNEASRSATQEENDSSTDGLCKLIDFSPSPKKVVSQTDKHAQEVTKENPNMEMPGNNDAKLMSKVKKTDIKAFTEEEMNQALKMQELLYQERLLKKDKQWNEKCKNANRERDLESSKVNSLHESQSQMT
ncbi:hypothetical protein GQR58_012820 [Nymphon striatum]|nr:hypothetical protein GQR58_012820 [Nymphon striatum]